MFSSSLYNTLFKVVFFFFFLRRHAIKWPFLIVRPCVYPVASPVTQLIKREVTFTAISTELYAWWFAVYGLWKSTRGGGECVGIRQGRNVSTLKLKKEHKSNPETWIFSSNKISYISVSISDMIWDNEVCDAQIGCGFRAERQRSVSYNLKCMWWSWKCKLIRNKNKFSLLSWTLLLSRAN